MEMNHREKEDAIRSRIASSFVVAIRLNPPGFTRSEIKKPWPKKLRTTIEMVWQPHPERARRFYASET